MKIVKSIEYKKNNYEVVVLAEGESKSEIFQFVKEQYELDQTGNNNQIRIAGNDGFGRNGLFRYWVDAGKKVDVKVHEL